MPTVPVSHNQMLFCVLPIIPTTLLFCYHDNTLPVTPMIANLLTHMKTARASLDIEGILHSYVVHKVARGVVCKKVRAKLSKLGNSTVYCTGTREEQKLKSFCEWWCIAKPIND